MTLAPRLATLAVAVLLVSGCGTAATVDAGSPAGTNRPASSKAADTKTTEPTEEGTTDAPAQDDGTAAFGKTYTWDDGLSIKVGKPTTFKPSEWAIGSAKGKTSVLMSVTIVNKTGKPFDPGMVYLTAQSGNEEAEQIFDSEKNVGGGPSTKVLNGREVTFKVGFAVGNPKDIVVEVAPDWDHDSVLFSS